MEKIFFEIKFFRATFLPFLSQCKMKTFCTGQVFLSYFFAILVLHVFAYFSNLLGRGWKKSENLQPFSLLLLHLYIVMNSTVNKLVKEHAE